MDLKDYKRVSSGSEFRDVVQTSDTEPRYRSNGHQLEWNASNSDYVDFGDVNFQNGTSLSVTFYFDKSKSNTFILGNSSSSESTYIQYRVVDGKLLISIKGSTQVSDFTLGDSGIKTVTVSKESDIISLNYLNNTYNTSFASSTIFVLNSVAKRANSYSDVLLHEFQINGETFSPTNIDSSAQIEGSNGTIAQVNSSAADPINYILGTVFQKSSFALVGDVSTQKIVSPLGGEIVLTSTPLEGGFDLDGKTYNLTEGLGNVIKSTDGTTECDIVGFSGTSLNFGGWQKGNSIDGWNPYTI